MRTWTLAISFCVVSATGDPAVDPRDLQRAKTRVPRSAWKGSDFASMSHVLNGHIQKMFPKTKPCDEWTAKELQDYQEALYAHRHTHFDSIYSGVSDNRRLRHASLAAHREHWARVNVYVQDYPHLSSMHRDGHCHEAVMWLVHHVPAAEQQTVFAQMPAPLLSTKRHDVSTMGNHPEVVDLYKTQITCAECHSGTGMLFQDWNDIPGIIPEDPKYPGWARQRRCDQNYQPACGPCEGVGGPYWGDEVSSFQPTNCEVVALPDAVPVADRGSPQFAEQFIVHQLGSDRLVRTQNAAKFAVYSQIRSTLWYDFPAEQDGIAKLRHDTYYDDLAYKWMDNGLVSEIHTQTKEQRAANITGPMVSLLHGLLGWGKYMGGLTCLADPVGVPVLGGTVKTLGVPHSAFLEGADYLGRIKIGVEYDGFKLGDKGHGDMHAKRNMTVDHYIKWFLHVFVDADPKSPTYRQPVRFYGPYSGFAVYVKFDKTVPPSEVWEYACPDNGWGENETKPVFPCKGKKVTDYPAMIVEKKHPEVCDFLNQTSRSANAFSDHIQGNFGSFFVPELSESAIVV
eukprot:gnl/MRDRNA2_/MRDRNA2_111904_c0_seq1.p1 gnl/MRDRNA2_/MRDRNA2_111904_c0~~gnl/MRDRNA2_/MRDRNA2_111904_c0_seq1.p1  ORF type:complete len:567 (-),score=92.90 gnl/MRDRNA2_/MRDRNA2_111904_c0_seq1:151-1851(-)